MSARVRCTEVARHGELVVERDPDRPSGRLLRQAGMEASYVDLADPAHLEFDYMRWMRIVLRAWGCRRVLHIGGAACALPRALAAEDPGTRHEVCEVDADVLALARRHLGLRRMPGLRVRHAEGRAHLDARADASYDAVVIDAFVGARIPEALIDPAGLAQAARVATGLVLVNVVDDRAQREVGRVSAAMAASLPMVWKLAARGAGNSVVIGCRESSAFEWIAAAAAADRSPARLTQIT